MAALLSDEPAFVLLSAHDQKWPVDRLERELIGAVGPGVARAERGPMTLRAQPGGRDLQMGCFVRWSGADR